jgi:hypothetical protein
MHYCAMILLFDSLPLLYSNLRMQSTSFQSFLQCNYNFCPTLVVTASCCFSSQSTLMHSEMIYLCAVNFLLVGIVILSYMGEQYVYCCQVHTILFILTSPMSIDLLLPNAHLCRWILQILVKC